MIIDDDDDAAAGIIAVSVFIGKVQALTHIFCFFLQSMYRLGISSEYTWGYAGGVDPW